MKVPNWFKIIWWVILLGITGTILYKRYSAIAEGKSEVTDVFIFLLFVALMLVPIFSEIEFFGIKLKKEIEDLKNDIKIKFGDIKNEIRNTQAQTFNASIQGFGPPPPDSKLPELEEQIERIVKEKLKEHQTNNQKINEVPSENLEMYKIRYKIEEQLSRIWEQHYKISLRHRRLPITRMLQDLSNDGVFKNDFYNILRETLSICNYAVHGEFLSVKQISFVTDNYEKLLDYLHQINWDS